MARPMPELAPVTRAFCPARTRATGRGARAAAGLELPGCEVMRSLLAPEESLDGRGSVTNATHRFDEAVIADGQSLLPIRDLVILGQADQLGVLRADCRLLVDHA